MSHNVESDKQANPAAKGGTDNQWQQVSQQIQDTQKESLSKPGSDAKAGNGGTPVEEAGKAAPEAKLSGAVGKTEPDSLDLAQNDPLTKFSRPVEGTSNKPNVEKGAAGRDESKGENGKDDSKGEKGRGDSNGDGSSSKPGSEKRPTEQQLRDAFGKRFDEGGTYGDALNYFVPKSVEMGHMQYDGSKTIETPDEGRLGKLQADKSRQVDLPDGKQPGAVFVNQGDFAVAPLDVPLSTADLGPCAGLVIVDKNGGKQYLAHIDSSTPAEQIRESLKGLNLNDPNLEVYLLPGSREGSPTPTNILNALADTPIGDKVKLVNWGDRPGMGPENRRGIQVFNGKISVGSNWPAQTFE